MRQLVLVVDSGCFVASIYALDVRMAKPLLNGRFFTIVRGLTIVILSREIYGFENQLSTWSSW